MEFPKALVPALLEFQAKGESVFGSEVDPHCPVCKKFVLAVDPHEVHKFCGRLCRIHVLCFEEITGESHALADYLGLELIERDRCVEKAAAPVVRGMVEICLRDGRRVDLPDDVAQELSELIEAVASGGNSVLQVQYLKGVLSSMAPPGVCPGSIEWLPTNDKNLLAAVS